MKKLLLPIFASITFSSSAFGGNTFVAPLVPILDIQTPSYYTLALKAGTLGLGIDFSLPLNEYFSTRLNVNGFSYNTNKTKNNIDYSLTATGLTAGLLLDYYPIQSLDFRLSSGVYYNGNALKGDAKAKAGSYTINGNTYTSAQVASISTKTKMNKVAPYIGIGWGNKGKEKGWGFSLDVGAIYQGKIGLDTTLTQTATSPATLKASVEAERKKLENDMSSYTFYPVIMLAVSYAF